MQPVARYYPGPDLVDVVGFDIDADRLDAGAFHAADSYRDLMALGKPFAITEVGPSQRRDGSFHGKAALDALLDCCPRCRYLLWWHSWSGGGILGRRHRLALIDNPEAATVLHDARVVALTWK